MCLATINVVSSTAILSNVVAGNQGLTKSGVGVLQINAVNTFSGDVSVTGGTLANVASTSLGASNYRVFAGNGQSARSMMRARSVR